ncbi:unnamed protein product, partial [Ectocarpus sp. 6 AP-2014]
RLTAPAFGSFKSSTSPTISPTALHYECFVVSQLPLLCTRHGVGVDEILSVSQISDNIQEVTTLCLSPTTGTNSPGLLIYAGCTTSKTRVGRCGMSLCVSIDAKALLGFAISPPTPVVSHMDTGTSHPAYL